MWNAVSVVMGLIIASSVTLNVLTIWVFTKSPKKTLYLILSLQIAISDVFQCLFGYSLEIFTASIINREKYIKARELLFCQISSFIVAWFSEASILFISLISLLKIFSQVKPFSFQNLQNNRLFRAFIIVCPWLFSLAWSSFPLLGWSSYVLEDNHQRCSAKFNAETSGEISYVLSLMIIFYLFPVTVNIVSYNVTGSSTKQHVRYCSKTYGDKNSVTLTVRTRKRRCKTLNFAMLTCFIIVWTPYALISILGQFVTVPKSLSNAGALLAKSSTAINPLLYCHRAKQMKLRKTSLFSKINEIF